MVLDVYYRKIIRHEVHIAESAEPGSPLLCRANQCADIDSM